MYISVTKSPLKRGLRAPSKFWLKMKQHTIYTHSWIADVGHPRRAFDWNLIHISGRVSVFAERKKNIISRGYSLVLLCAVRGALVRRLFYYTGCALFWYNPIPSACQTDLLIFFVCFVYAANCTIYGPLYFVFPAFHPLLSAVLPPMVNKKRESKTYTICKSMNRGISLDLIF